MLLTHCLAREPVTSIKNRRVETTTNHRAKTTTHQSMTEKTHQTTLQGAGDDDGWSLKDIDWTFEGANTKRYTHGLHSYPARMVPQIPEMLLSYFKKEDVISEGDTVYDPFSGSGTTAVEGRLAGLNAEANDINPLACLLTLAKSRPLDRGLLDDARRRLLDGLEECLNEVATEWENGERTVEDTDIRDGWFPEPQLHQLIAIREQINELEIELQDETEIEDDEVQDVIRFLRVALSSTTRDVSYQRNGEYKRYRLSEEDRKDHNPDVYTRFTSELNEDIDRIKEYTETVDHSLTTDVYYADSREADDIAEDSIDIVITSPPYGDHGTTVAYGQFSQDPAIVSANHGYDEMKDVDKTGLGGSYSLEPMEELENQSDALEATLESLREKDGRAEDALDFFTDYYAVMEQVARVLKPGQPVAWVVANRTMSRVNIPTQLITRELCEHIGFKFETILPREIPTKTLPWENAPENVPGIKGDLMANENIVVMTAPE